MCRVALTHYLARHTPPAGARSFCGSVTQAPHIPPTPVGAGSGTHCPPSASIARRQLSVVGYRAPTSRNPSTLFSHSILFLLLSALQSADRNANNHFALHTNLHQFSSCKLDPTEKLDLPPPAIFCPSHHHPSTPSFSDPQDGFLDHAPDPPQEASQASLYSTCQRCRQVRQPLARRRQGARGRFRRRQHCRSSRMLQLSLRLRLLPLVRRAAPPFTSDCRAEPVLPRALRNGS